ncbi:MAG: dynamin family protein, partial [Acidobacteriota bacterium]
MDQVIEDTKKLREWYQSHVSSFLKGNLPERFTEFERDFIRIDKAISVCERDLDVCLLGSSGIGKSTLVNAILGGLETVVPSGGVGPLTAQALEVEFSESPWFRVEYHGSGPIWRTIFSLEQSYKKELGAPLLIDEPTAKDLEESDETELPIESEIVALKNGGDDSPDEHQTEARERLEEIRRRAQLLVAGVQDQKKSLHYLLDSLRQTLHRERIWRTNPEPDDALRLERISEAVELAKQKKSFFLSGSFDDVRFRASLNEHATGFLAPLIKTLTLGWDAPILSEGVRLVDLPGVGIALDVHKEITRRWIREKAHALVMVVDHRGLPASVAESLHRSEFLNSLLYSADEPDDDPILIVVVTRIDDLANERYRQDRSKKKRTHFEEATDEAKARIYEDVRKYLEDTWVSHADA